MTEPSMEERGLSFGREAASYDANRPSYPREAVAWVLEAATRKVRDVADVGAGTGALTSLLVSLDFDVTAFDADGQMLDRLRLSVPEVTAIVARAEQLALDDASVDAVMVAQAFHWFDPVATSKEFSRVLRPGGVVGLFWNLRDDRALWWAALRPIINGPDWERSDGDEALHELAQVFSNVERHEFPHLTPMTHERIVNLVGTFSFVRLRDDANDVLEQVRSVLATHPDTKDRDVIDVPYVTAAYRVRFPGAD
ncbi:MAG TPA: class I SAM-dependent methyltransferase [Acidimicrobiales bacterium]